jgi:uncharacterized protein
MGCMPDRTSPRAAVTGPVRGPVTAAERSLTPDLARGVMLLFIAVANAPLYLYGRPYGLRMHVIEDGLADRLSTFAVMTFADGRAYPMFAALFGYGMVQLVRRQRASGTPELVANRLLWRRNAWLLAFGGAHALLLFPGDILGAYALAGWLVLPVLGISDRQLLIAAAVLVIPVVLLGSTYGLAPAPGDTMVGGGLDTADPGHAAVARVEDWLSSTPFTTFVVLLPLVLGVVAARRGYLDQPDRHRRVLRRTAVAGIGVAVAGGLPLALTVASVLPRQSTGVELVLAALHTLTGVAGGLGYAALIGLATAKLGAANLGAANLGAANLGAGDRRPGPVVTALAACGERSLSCYLAQSVVFVLLLTSGFGGLGGVLGSADVAVVAVATWGTTVLLADLLRRSRRRGPCERVLRRLTYGR